MNVPTIIATAAVLTSVAFYATRPIKRNPNRKQNKTTLIVRIINMVGRLAKRIGFNLVIVFINLQLLI